MLISGTGRGGWEGHNKQEIYRTIESRSREYVQVFCHDFKEFLRMEAAGRGAGSSGRLSERFMQTLLYYVVFSSCREVCSAPGLV